MSTLQEIKTAIAGLNEHDKTLLAAELFAEQAPTPDDARLAVSLERGLQDVEAGRVRPLQEARVSIEDLLESRAAVERNAGKPGTPWEQVKGELNLE